MTDEELDMALSTDDALYAKFEQLYEQLREREMRFDARKRIREVRKRTYIGAGHIDLQMTILKVHDTNEGAIIFVE